MTDDQHHRATAALNMALRVKAAMSQADLMRGFFGTQPTTDELRKRAATMKEFYDALIATVQEPT